MGEKQRSFTTFDNFKSGINNEVKEAGELDLQS